MGENLADGSSAVRLELEQRFDKLSEIPTQSIHFFIMPVYCTKWLR